jgi:hypothetical protein
MLTDLNIQCGPLAWTDEGVFYGVLLIERGRGDANSETVCGGHSATEMALGSPEPARSGRGNGPYLLRRNRQTHRAAGDSAARGEPGKHGGTGHAVGREKAQEAQRVKSDG